MKVSLSLMRVLGFPGLETRAPRSPMTKFAAFSTGLVEDGVPLRLPIYIQYLSKVDNYTNDLTSNSYDLLQKSE